MEILEASKNTILAELKSIINTRIKTNNANGYIRFLEELNSDIMFNLNIIKRQIFNYDTKINIQPKKFGLLEKSSSGLITINYDTQFQDISESDDDDDIKNSQDTNHIILDTVKHVKIPKIQIPVASSFGEIKPFLRWYSGDTKHSAGLYMCLSNNVFIKVPFENTVHSQHNEARINSIRCIYETHEKCLINRKANAQKYNMPIKMCNYLHKHDKYTKVGNVYRCQDNPMFGNFDTLVGDIRTASIRDIKTLLLYSLSDLMLVFLWSQSVPHDTIIFDRLEYFY